MHNEDEPEISDPYLISPSDNPFGVTLLNSFPTKLTVPDFTLSSKRDLPFLIAKVKQN